MNKEKAMRCLGDILFIQDYLSAHVELDGMSGEFIKEAYSYDITNEDGKYIDINYRHILITYDVEKQLVCDTFEKYNNDGIFLGTMNINDYFQNIN